MGCISSQKKVFLKKSHFSPTLQAHNSKVFENYFIFFAGNAFSARARYFAPYRTSQLPKSQKLQPVENWYGKPTFFHSKPVGRSWIGTTVERRQNKEDAKLDLVFAVLVKKSHL